MTGLRLLIAAIALAPGMALACSPAPGVPGQVTRNAECAFSYQDDEYTSRGLGNAADLGAGIVSQFYVAGNACYANVSMIVIDCNTARAAIFGPGPTHGPMTFDDPDVVAKNRPFQELRDAVEAAAAAGKPMPLEAVRARANGTFINAAVVGLRGRIGISNDETAPLHSFDLSCGCKLFYKDLPGARP